MMLTSALLFFQCLCGAAKTPRRYWFGWTDDRAERLDLPIGFLRWLANFECL